MVSIKGILVNKKNPFLLEWSPFEKGSKNIQLRVISLSCVSIQLALFKLSPYQARGQLLISNSCFCINNMFLVNVIKSFYMRIVKVLIRLHMNAQADRGLHCSYILRDTHNYTHTCTPPPILPYSTHTHTKDLHISSNKKHVTLS